MQCTYENILSAIYDNTIYRIGRYIMHVGPAYIYSVNCLVYIYVFVMCIWTWRKLNINWYILYFILVYTYFKSYLVFKSISWNRTHKNLPWSSNVQGRTLACNLSSSWSTIHHKTHINRMSSIIHQQKNKPQPFIINNWNT